jgi:hypothetical protein
MAGGGTFSSITHPKTLPAHEPRTAGQMLPDASRDEGRANARDAVRMRPREPHEKYTLDPKSRARDRDYVFVATKIRGAPNPRLGEFYRAGWRPERAIDFPELSDFGLYDPTLVEMGVVPKVNPDSPVIRDDQMLMGRPKPLSAAAVKEDEDRARRQLEEHLRQQRDRSRAAIGDRTRISRTYGPNDIVPDDEEGMEAR